MTLMKYYLFFLNILYCLWCEIKSRSLSERIDANKAVVV